MSEEDTDEESGPPMDGMAYLKQVIKVWLNSVKRLDPYQKETDP